MPHDTPYFNRTNDSTSGPAPVKVVDSTGDEWVLEDNGGMPVNSRSTDPNDSTRHGLFDPFLAVPQEIDTVHSKVHGGLAFHAGFIDESMAASDTIVLAFKTDPSTFVHMVYSFKTLTGGHVDIYKDSTWTNQTGTQLPIYNRNHNSSTASTILEDQSSASFVATGNIIANPTGVTNGTQVLPSDFAFGSVFSPASGTRAEEEIVLEADTQYTFVFTADTANNKGSLHFDWYE